MLSYDGKIARHMRSCPVLHLRCVSSKVSLFLYELVWIYSGVKNAMMSDACVCGRWDVKDVRAAGARNERWRFAHTRDDWHDVNPRARTLRLMVENLLNTRANVPSEPADDDTPCLVLSYPLVSFVKLHSITCLFNIPNRCTSKKHAGLTTPSNTSCDTQSTGHRNLFIGDILDVFSRSVQGKVS